MLNNIFSLISFENSLKPIIYNLKHRKNRIGNVFLLSIYFFVFMPGLRNTVLRVPLFTLIVAGLMPSFVIAH